MDGPESHETRRASRDGSMSLPEGVHEVEHTADTGIEVSAGSLQELLHRAALGTLHLVRGGSAERPAGAATEIRTISLEASAPDLLLARWLQEVLYLREVDGLEYAGAQFDTLTTTALEAKVTLYRDPAPPVWEIKGVTYHGLAAEERNGEWWARVIFDL